MAETRAYIQTAQGIINLKAGTSCPITKGIADIRNPEKRGGTFSKQLIAVWDDDNHRILGQIFDINATNDLFDINKRVQCEVIENGTPVVEDAYLQLLDINEDQTTDSTQQQGSFTLLVKGAQRDLFTQMGAKELDELDFTYLNHTYSAANVVASFSHDYTDGYTYPMGINDDNEFFLTDFRPAIYLKEYFDQIHATNGFSYEVQDWDVFEKLVIPHNGDEPVTNQTDFIVQANKSSFSSGGGNITSWTETLDDESIFNPTTGVYDVPVYIDAGQAIDCAITIDFDLVLSNASGANAYLVDLTNSGFDRSVRYRGYYEVYKNGSLHVRGQFITPSGIYPSTGHEYFESDTPIAAGDNTILTEINSINIPISNLLPTDTLTFRISVAEEAGNQLPAFMAWKDAASTLGNDVTVTPRIDITSVRMALSLTANTVGFGFEQDMNLYVPSKTKQKDLVRSVCIMGNLMVYPDPDNPNKIIYRPRDQYYDAGATKNWSKKLVKNQNQLVKFLPELNKKRMQFSYKDDSDTYNTVYKDNIKETYGQAEFIFDTEFREGVDRKELIFSPTPMAEIAIGAIVPSFVGAAPKTNIRILIHNGTETCNSYNIYDYDTTGQTGLTDYPMVSHFDDHYNPTIDINFAVCDYYFYPGVTLTNNNLFNMHWRRTMSQLNSGKMLTAMFDLNENDISSLQLNDKIWVRNAWWNINQVIDYDANGERPTKVELISSDEELDLPSFRKRIYVPLTPDSWNDPLGPLIEDVYTINNTNYSGGAVIVKGKGNVILPNLRGMVVGSHGYINQSGYWYEGERVGGDPEAGTKEPLTTITVSTNYIADVTVIDAIIVDTSGVTITLPPVVVTDNQDQRIWIKNFSNGKITISGPSDIDNSNSLTLNKGEAVTLISTADRYYIV